MQFKNFVPTLREVNGGISNAMLDEDFLPSWQEVNTADPVRQWSTGRNVSQLGSHSWSGNLRPTWAEVLAREMVFKLDTIFSSTCVRKQPTRTMPDRLYV